MRDLRGIVEVLRSRRDPRGGHCDPKEASQSCRDLILVSGNGAER